MRIEDEDVEACRAIGRHRAAVVPDRARIMTICNAGALATAGYGTALGVVRAAHEAGKRPFVWVLETRPRLQGMRLTAWEMQQEGIPYNIVTDGMAGTLMKSGEVDLIVTGADRIAANGDTANKIGTYSVAVLARYHGVPFYVAAALSTVDPGLAHGGLIPIEERSEDEITDIGGIRLAPPDARAHNPAFDVTPNELIAGIITEVGFFGPSTPGLCNA